MAHAAKQKVPTTASAALATYEDAGLKITFYELDGRMCVIAVEIGHLYGYANDGKKLVDIIRDKWADEMRAGRDFDVLAGVRLRDFKEQAGDTLPRWVSSTARLMVLYESGVDVVTMKTEKPAGVRLRRFLADEVIPKLRRGEAVLPDGERPAAEFRPVDGSKIGDPVIVGRDGRRQNESTAAIVSSLCAFITAQLAAAEVRAAEARAQDRAFYDRLLSAHAPGTPPPEAGPGFARQLCRDLDVYAAMMAPEGDRPAIKMWRGKGETGLRERLGYAGKGSAWRRLPASRRDDALRAIEGMLDTARAVAGQRQAAAQGDLFKKH